jgi:hypothetical protein
MFLTLYSLTLSPKIFFSAGCRAGKGAQVGYFEGKTTYSILQCKTEKPKEKFQIFKSFSDMFRWFEFEGEEG